MVIIVHIPLGEFSFVRHHIQYNKEPLLHFISMTNQILIFRFSCEFHITQDDPYDEDEDSDDDYEDYDEEDDEDELQTSTLMSVHLDTFLDKRYEWYHMRRDQLPKPIRYVVGWLMDLLGIHYHCLMFWLKNHNEVLENLINVARQVSQGSMS